MSGHSQLTMATLCMRVCVCACVCRLGWMATKPQGVSCPQLPSAGITGAHHHACPFDMDAKIQTQLLLFVQQALFP